MFYVHLTWGSDPTRDSHHPTRGSHHQKVWPLARCEAEKWDVGKIHIQRPKRQPSLQFRCGLVMENFQPWPYFELSQLIYIVYPDEILQVVGLACRQFKVPRYLKRYLAVETPANHVGCIFFPKWKNHAVMLQAPMLLNVRVPFRGCPGWHDVLWGFSWLVALMTLHQSWQ